MQPVTRQFSKFPYGDTERNRIVASYPPHCQDATAYPIRNEKPETRKDYSQNPGFIKIRRPLRIPKECPTNTLDTLLIRISIGNCTQIQDTQEDVFAD